MQETAVKILIVDDEEDFTKPIVFWFQSKGYPVRAAANGEEALKMIQEDKPDIVFLDLVMPVMDGTETLMRIRKIDKDLPVVIISAYIDPQKIGELKPMGISGVFFKGQSFTAMTNLIDSALSSFGK